MEGEEPLVLVRLHDLDDCGQEEVQIADGDVACGERGCAPDLLVGGYE